MDFLLFHFTLFLCFVMWTQSFVKGKGKFYSVEMSPQTFMCSNFHESKFKLVNWCACFAFILLTLQEDEPFQSFDSLEWIWDDKSGLGGQVGYVEGWWGYI